MSNRQKKVNRHKKNWSNRHKKICRIDPKKAELRKKNMSKTQKNVKSTKIGPIFWGQLDLLLWVGLYKWLVLEF